MHIVQLHEQLETATTITEI